ncbi:hypothetical protein O0I10_004948 [Lichtheimia ornata]|uniref:PSP proline-rich domain-containing protein n=1 Tax=Lichtheimia ornata TaxID=688661 RepID=A0AAD7V5D2_9FUNG|nr:uncharacterized protein O0I10_004948 [Lichtheimia ornata]KAJ8659234.1 hypothetical protein O0I10_004948 [Lichtheimia ornata]
MATRHDISPDRISLLKQKRRAKKKARKQRKNAEAATTTSTNATTTTTPDAAAADNVSLVLDQPIELPSASEWQALGPVIEHFSIPTLTAATETKDDTNTNEALVQSLNKDKNESTNTISKKKLKRLAQLTVSELKQLTDVPEVVEPWDTTASDPDLLVTLKSYRNTVPVPRHWWWKRRGYLQRKERLPWQLPDYIAQTGIADKRDAMREKEAQARASAKRRARLNPKLGKMDVDYQKLHDAFFRFPIRVELTRHGELYYEGKEWSKTFKPGELSDTLRDALHMQSNDPPPWLFAMQHIGPPPSYAGLKVPGVNAPIPHDCELGYQRGGWGAPPQVGEKDIDKDDKQEDVDKSLWGELEPELEYKDMDEEEAVSEEEHEEAINEEEIPITEMDMSGDIELRKRPPIEEKEEPNETKHLYHVLSQSSRGTMQGFMGSQYTYNLAPKKGRHEHDVDISMEDPSELENLSSLQSKYEQGQMEEEEKEKRHYPQPEDLSDMYMEHINRQAKRMKQLEKRKESRKKEFRF